MHRRHLSIQEGNLDWVDRQTNERTNLWIFSPINSLRICAAAVFVSFHFSVIALIFL